MLSYKWEQHLQTLELGLGLVLGFILGFGVGARVYSILELGLVLRFM